MSSSEIGEFSFLLHDVFAIQDRTDLTGFSDLTSDLTAQILDGIAKFSSEVLAPLNTVGDIHGCRLDSGTVQTPPGFVDAYRRYCEAGWNRLSAPEEFGGADLPEVLSIAANEITSCANSAFSHYPGLTNGARASISRAGSDWMREQVVPKMVSGEWTGTMCLTEAHCGTDLRLMTTKAVRADDGTYRINGTKIFITGGDHDLTGNVIHLVLAKLPDENGNFADDLATVSLFLVPKFMIERPEIRNGVSVGGLENKMGLKGSATCVLNFDDAVGYKLGSTKANAAKDSKSSGMSAMFDMMNHARLETGVNALAVAGSAYAKARAYAHERLAGRAPDPADRSNGRADPIIVHADVRRMLMKQRAFIDGARALALWTALLLDTGARASTEQAAAEATALASLMTPVIKAYFSDRGFEASNLAVQIFGGHGYIRDTGVEQHVRDGRIFQLYEGANGIQALDLVTRKLPANGGKAFIELCALIEAELEHASEWPELRCQIVALQRGVKAMVATSELFVANAGSDLFERGAASYDFLNQLGTVLIGFMWLWMGRVALGDLRAGSDDAVQHQRRLALGDYWAEREMPFVTASYAAASAGGATLKRMPAEAF